MEIQLRPITPVDAPSCGRIVYEAFKGIAERHHFRPDFASVEIATGLVQSFIESEMVFGVVAEGDTEIVGSNFLWEFDPIRAVGPITVDPRFQGHGVGRRLMQAVIERGRDATGVRLLQDTFNTTSLSLYASLGFDVKEPVVIIEGRLGGKVAPGFEVRPMRDEDHAACAELCRRVHGFERINELKNTPPVLTPFVALREGRVTAYGSALTFWALNHAVAESEEDMRALLTGASLASAEPLSFILPTRQAALFRWCLQQGLRVIKPMTLMAMGQYQNPQGCYLPSVGY
jgi:GNAT superfamily N-acetyltransferase